jgi:hypothetical protein
MLADINFTVPKNCVLMYGINVISYIVPSLILNVSLRRQFVEIIVKFSSINTTMYHHTGY